MKTFDVCSSKISTGLTLLEAGAGTGKTYSLVHIIARHLVENNLTIDQILTVTFTRAATAEIKSRLHELLTEISQDLKRVELSLNSTPKKTTFTPKLNDLVKHWVSDQSSITLQHARIQISNALANFDSVPIFTIDGFFQRLLKEFAFEANSLFSVELDTDETSLQHIALLDYWREFVYPMTAEELSLFRQHINLKKTPEFLQEVLRNPQVKLDTSYTKNPSELIRSYLDLWEPFIASLQEQRDHLADFITNPPSEFKLSGYPFFKKGEPMRQQIDELLSQPDSLKLDLGNLSKLSFSHLQSDSVFKKGKFIDLTNHPLAPLFKQIDVLITSAPKNLNSAYFGEIFRFVNHRLHTLKQERNVQSYSDVTNTLAQIFTDNTPSAISIQQSIRKKFHACLIDEFQDTSPQQCAVFINLFRHSDGYFHIIGDPKQSIYRFRGADVFSYIAAKKKAEETQIYSLLTNRRSTPRMIHAVNQFFSFHPEADPFCVDKKITFSPSRWIKGENDSTPPGSGTALHIHQLSQDLNTNAKVDSAIQRNIAEEILKLLDTPWKEISPDHESDSVVQPSDIAILVRSAKEGEQISKTLASLGIPITLNSKNTLLQSTEAEDVFTILSALLEPRKSGLVKLALLTTPMGKGKHFLEKDQNTFDAIINDMAEIHKQWQHLGLMPAMLRFIQQFQVRITLLNLTQGQRHLTNFMHLIELLDDKARREKLTPVAIVQWLEMAIQNDVQDMDSEVLELRISTDDSAVQIRTQHTSKGLEFPITFVLSPCKKDHSQSPLNLTYHDPDTGALHLASVDDDSSSPSYSIRQKETFSDDARLTYVALTRSKYLCHFYLLPQNEKRAEEHAIYQILGLPSQENLQTLAEDSSGCIEILPLEEVDTTLPSLSPWHGNQKSQHTDSPAPLQCRDLSHINISHKQRTTSFSGITRNAHDIIHDSDSDTDSSLDSSSLLPSAEASSSISEASFWGQLKPGASLGLVFHELLEEIDFADKVQIAPQSLIIEKLLKYHPWEKEPPSLESLSQDISTFLGQWVQHPLDSSGIRLLDIPLSKRLTEPEFLLSGSHFSISTLATILAKDPPEGLPDHYRNQLNNHQFPSSDGFLTGFIDLIFEHNGRYHLLDWKTNKLSNYSRDSIAKSMADHHYFLQYHLYTLALDRFLAQRLDNYTAEKHLGNVYYVYLRGINPEVPGSGVFSDKITSNRLQALRTAFLF